MDPRASRPRGGHRMPRGGPTHHHHQQPRMMANAHWQNNTSTYQTQDEGMTPYHPQSIEGYPTFYQAGIPPTEMVNTQAAYPAGYHQPQLCLSPQNMYSPMGETVYINTPPLPMCTSTPPPPVVNSSMMPPKKLAYNSIDQIVLCSKCEFKNVMAECELKKKDDDNFKKDTEITRLQLENNFLIEKNKILDIENKRLKTILDSNGISVSTKSSQLSPDAVEFSPKTDKTEVICKPDDVPVVSAKGVGDEIPIETNTEQPVELVPSIQQLPVEEIKTETVSEVQTLANVNSFDADQSSNIISAEPVKEEEEMWDTATPSGKEEEMWDAATPSGKEEEMWDAPTPSGKEENVQSEPQPNSQPSDTKADDWCEDDVNSSSDVNMSNATPASAADMSNPTPASDANMSNPTPTHSAEAESKPASMDVRTENSHKNYRNKRKSIDQTGQGSSFTGFGRGKFTPKSEPQHSMEPPQQNFHTRSNDRGNYNNQSRNYTQRNYKNDNVSRDGETRNNQKPAVKDTKGDVLREPGDNVKNKDGFKEARDGHRGSREDVNQGRRYDDTNKPYKPKYSNERGGYNKNQNQDYQNADRYHYKNKRPSGRSSEDLDKCSSSSDNAQKSGSWGNYNRRQFARNLKEVKGDLFEASNEFSLAHCVARDFRMGSGIAVEFRRKFNRVSELMDQKVDVGGCAFLYEEKEKRHIFYLVTKLLSHWKPTNETLKSSLLDMSEKCKKFGVTKLAMPRIGCGLDKLNWFDVRDMISEVFQDTGIEIVIYDFNVAGVSEAEGNKPSNGVLVKSNVMNLVTIEPFTALVFFGTEDGHMDTTATSLNNKFRFENDYKKAEKTVGKIWCYEKPRDYLIYSLIVMKKHGDELSFSTLDECIRDLTRHIRKTKFNYVGIEAFVDWSQDQLFTERVVTLLRFSLPKHSVSELWVCYREAKDDVYEMCNKFRAKH